MADDEDLDWWEEENYDATDPEQILKPVGAGLGLLSLASCVVMATVMLRSSLRRASWTPYMLLWAAAEALLMLMFVVEGVFVKVNRSHDASFFGCLVYYFVHHSANFLSTASVMALSLDLLLRGLKPSLFGPRCSLHVTLALLVCGLLLYCPTFFITDASYQHRQVHMCLADYQYSSAATLRLVYVYLYVSLFLVAVPWPALVCVGLVVLWWKRRQFSDHLRILAAFLLGFLLLGLPKALFDTVVLVSLYHSISDYYYEFVILHYVVLVCSFVKPLVILGCLSTSSDFRRALKDTFRRPFYRVERDNPGFIPLCRGAEGGPWCVACPERLLCERWASAQDGSDADVVPTARADADGEGDGTSSTIGGAGVAGGVETLPLRSCPGAAVTTLDNDADVADFEADWDEFCCLY